MADIGHGDAGRTLRHAGFYTDHKVDAHWADWDEQGNKTLKTPESARPDFIYTGSGIGGAMEVKTAEGKNRENWYFKNWRPNQREWCETWTTQYKNPYWLFILFGRGHKKGDPFKELVVLYPHYEVLKLEQTIGRKSIPYEVAADSPFRIEWGKYDKWIIPPMHRFWERGHYDQLFRAG